ncbi:MAG: hypothetical protein R2854_28685 [Caldilineaceae bacterium]
MGPSPGGEPTGLRDDAPSTGLGWSAAMKPRLSRRSRRGGSARHHRFAGAIARGEPAGLRDDAPSTGLGGQRR